VIKKIIKNSHVTYFHVKHYYYLVNILRQNFGDLIDRVAVAKGRYAVVTGKSKGPWNLFYMDMNSDSYYENAGQFHIICTCVYIFHNILSIN